MKKCKDCGSVFSDDYSFCNICGTKAPAFSSTGQVFLSILKALGFVAFFEVVQSVMTVFFTILVCVYQLVNYGFSGFDPELILSSILDQSFLISIVSGSVTVIMFFLFFVIRKKSFADEIKIKKFTLWTIPLILIMGIALNFFTSFSMAFIPIPDKLIEIYDEMYSTIGEGNRIVEFIAVAVIAPIAEEITFRAFAFGMIRKKTPFWFAALVSSVIFGIAHMNPISFVYTTLLGFLLAYLYEKTGSIIVPILLHFGFNSGMYFVERVPDSSPLVYAAIVVISSVVMVAAAGGVIAAHREKEEEPGQTE